MSYEVLLFSFPFLTKVVKIRRWVSKRENEKHNRGERDWKGRRGRWRPSSKPPLEHLHRRRRRKGSGEPQVKMTNATD